MLNNRKAARGLSSFGIAMESIDFQRDSFGSQLEAILYGAEKFILDKGGLIVQSRMRLQDSEFPGMLSDLIFKRLGIKTSVIMNTATPGAIMPFFATKHHVLMDPMWHGQFELKDQEKILKNAKNKIGTIDLTNARVGGIFSEYEHKLWVDVAGNLLNFKMTVPEVTAIILHELGHAFTYYEFADRLESTNQVLTNLSMLMRKGDEAEGGKKQYLMKELAEKFGQKSEDFDDILNEKNQVIFGMKLFKKYIDFVKSQLPNAKYDTTASEQLADNFAARFGYGRQLITALDRFYTGAPEKSAVGRFGANFGGLFEIIILPAVGALYTLMLGIVPAILIFSLILMLITFLCGESFQDMTYDVLKMRYTRIRQQYIEMITTLDLKKEELREVVDSIHEMDTIIKSTSIYKSLITRLSNFIFSKHRATKNDVEMQYLLEALTHNNLYLKSAELEVLS